jgi:predicted phosphodiesterase
MSGITWVHLSDWHQGATDFDRGIVKDGLIEDIKERTARMSPDLERIDFVAFTGDLAFSGTAAQYELALQEFVRPVLRACGLVSGGQELLDRFFIVPGNHDVNREISAYLRSDLSFFRDRRRLTATLIDANKRSVVMSPLREYEEFVTKKLNGGGCGKCSSYGFSAALDIGGHEVRIVGLNSAWLCGLRLDASGEVDDYGNIIVGEPQLMHALDGVDGADLVIGMIHHPFHWLALKDSMDDRAKVRNRLMDKCHIILHGHEHQPAVIVQETTRGCCVG